MSPWQKNPGFNNFQNVKLTEPRPRVQMPQPTRDHIEPIQTRKPKQIDDSNFRDEDEVKKRSNKWPILIVGVALFVLVLMVKLFNSDQDL